MHDMTTTSHWLRREIRLLVAIAVPVVVDNVAIMSMGMVDTILVGRLGAAQLGAVGTGAALYFAFMTFCLGVLNGITAIVAHAAGARDDDEVASTLAQGVWVALALAAIAIVYIGSAGTLLRLLGEPAEVIPQSERYLAALSWGIPGMLLNNTLRAFSIGLGQTRVPMVVSVVGATLNLVLASLLIFGGLGLPALGVAGAGYATATVHWTMFAATLVFVLRGSRFAEYRARFALRLDRARILRLVRLGVPIGVGSSLETAVFALTTLIMGRIGTISVAAHQVAINVAATTFMVPLGVAIATTTRVGHAAGSGDMRAAARAGWTGIATGMGFMAITALAFLLFRHQITALYTTDRDVAALAATLLLIGGAFQLGDGLQVTAQGALRGLKDTTRPMLVNLLAYWLLGLPVGLVLAFGAGMRGPGLWWGLTLGLSVAGALHVARFRRLSRAH
jgi:MATE family multidrug resistance protein